MWKWHNVRKSTSSSQCSFKEMDSPAITERVFNDVTSDCEFFSSGELQRSRMVHPYIWHYLLTFRTPNTTQQFFINKHTQNVNSRKSVRLHKQ
mmetsp:Transcript_5610/g.21107  ORF Transcript_5610/g.21107 Transcript_5610/m.21107 type:complete len:93 (-) Transcript_5610:1922-2200(-)